ncbi:MAG: hypothetical protein ACYCVY_11750 [Acidiferrobacteraceae bacterium]
MTRKHEERIADTIGWAILVSMGLAIVFGGSKAIGVVSGAGSIAIVGYVGYLYWRHPDEFQLKK